jgi:hypothetical protein
MPQQCQYGRDYWDLKYGIYNTSTLVWIYSSGITCPAASQIGRLLPLSDSNQGKAFSFEAGRRHLLLFATVARPQEMQHIRAMAWRLVQSFTTLQYFSSLDINQPRALRVLRSI